MIRGVRSRSIEMPASAVVSSARSFPSNSTALPVASEIPWAASRWR